MTSETASLRFLIERLNWPLRMVRWRVAREFGALLASKDHSEAALDVYLEWLSTRLFESEVVSALAVLLCTDESSLPSFELVSDRISRPSILADILLQEVYGKGKVHGQWETAHSGESPSSFEAEKFFADHKSSHVPPILSHKLTDLEIETGLPFMKQWAYEWHRLMEATDSPRSGYPYYFVDSILRQSGVNGQFSQRQCDVYRSAFLRTLACAVAHWGMPANSAALRALESLPLIRGLANLDPIDRPPWLLDIPEQCAESADESLEKLIRDLIAAGSDKHDMQPVSLKIPISTEIAEFADLSVMALLVSSDFVPDLDNDASSFQRTLPWILPDGISAEGALEHAEISKFFAGGTDGKAAPICLDLWPLPSGFWLNEYFQIGISLPGPYVFSGDTHLSCKHGGIEIISGAESVADWRVWHDHWTPLYAKDGATRCGTVTNLNQHEIAKARDRHEMTLGWLVELNIWQSKTDYGELELTSRREFFFD